MDIVTDYIFFFLYENVMLNFIENKLLKKFYI